jgi:hypothetical protein
VTLRNVEIFTVFSVLVDTSFNRLLQTPCWQQVVTLQNAENFMVRFWGNTAQPKLLNASCLENFKDGFRIFSGTSK